SMSSRGACPITTTPRASDPMAPPRSVPSLPSPALQSAPGSLRYHPRSSPQRCESMPAASVSADLGFLHIPDPDLAAVVFRFEPRPQGRRPSKQSRPPRGGSGGLPRPPRGISELAQLGIQGVAEPVAQEVEGQDYQEDGQPRQEGDPPG